MKLNKASTIVAIAAAVITSGGAIAYSVERFLAVESAVDELAGESIAGKLQRAREQVRYYNTLRQRRQLNPGELKLYRYWQKRVIELERKLKKLA